MWRDHSLVQIIKEEGLQQNSLEVGTYLMMELAKLRDKYDIIGDVRGKGLQIGVEMVRDKVADLFVLQPFLHFETALILMLNP